MAIDVPYSYLVKDGDVAWTCGQLALDEESAVLHPGDLAAQSDVVCDHIEAILARAELTVGGVKCLYLYHCGHDATAVAEMVAVFRHRFGPDVLLAPLAVPHFYYDGIMLEVDLWWAQSSQLRWVAEAAPEAGTARLSEHVFLPSARLGDLAGGPVPVPDPGAVVDAGPFVEKASFHAIEVVDEVVMTDLEERDGVVTVVRRAGVFTWVQGRASRGGDLVTQTESIMGRFDRLLPSLGLDYPDVAKSTTHYVGAATADELHDNMTVRNRRYRRPGPASTGLPVFGFADPASKVVVDITLVRR